MRTAERIVLWYLERDNYDPDTWNEDDPKMLTEGLPARCDHDSPMFHIELVLDGGTAAGGAWLVFEIVDCIDDELIGKRICCSADYTDGEWIECTYRARMEWDDGFVSNAALDREDLPYHEGEEPNGSGTPMDGEIIPDLDGMRFLMHRDYEARYVRRMTPFRVPRPAQLVEFVVGDWAMIIGHDCTTFPSHDLEGWAPRFGRVTRVGRGHPDFREDIFLVEIEVTHENGVKELRQFTSRDPEAEECIEDVGMAGQYDARLLIMPGTDYRWGD